MSVFVSAGLITAPPQPLLCESKLKTKSTDSLRMIPMVPRTHTRPPRGGPKAKGQTNVRVCTQKGQKGEGVRRRQGKTRQDKTRQVCA